MAGHVLCLLFSPKLAFVLLSTVLRAPGVSIANDEQSDWIAECKDEDVSSWHPLWYPSTLSAKGTKCNVQCLLSCRCILGNFSEVMINCSNGSMTVLHVPYPSNITHLSWAHNNLYNISKESFCGVADTVENIHLNNNNLSHLQPEVFKCLIKLIRLDLRHNLLEEIKADMFRGLTNMKWLDGSSNLLKTVQPNVFKGSSYLQWLDLHNNVLTELKVQPDVFGEILPGVFKGLGNLSHLYLNSNKLKAIQPGVFTGLGNLSLLFLDSNNLKEIQPGVFTGLGNLWTLSLDSNLLKEIQSDVFTGLGNLWNLSLDSNMLKEIPLGVFTGFGNLSSLSLKKNMLAEIQPGVFNGLGNLFSLRMDRNLLTELKPGVFTGMDELTSLHFPSNMLTKLPPTVLGELTSLGLLTLSDNPLAHLHPDTFQNLTSLYWLSLSNVSLTFLPENIFQTLRALRHLDLSVNNLQELKFHPFERCTFLEILNLTQNPLQWISKDSFIGLRVSALVLVDNPASCCFVTKVNYCIFKSSKSPFLTCRRMLPYEVLRVGIWVVSVFAIVNNVVGILTRCRQRKQVNKVQFLLITNLSMSDLLMGVYLIILLSVDLYYTDYFPSHSDSWRNSTLCDIAGSLSVLSSEASVFFITLISIDRFLRVKFPFGKYWLSKKSATVVLSILWLLAFGISITSFILSGIYDDAYDLSEICVGLPITRYSLPNTKEISVEGSYGQQKRFQKHVTQGSQVAMYFSVAIFTILNMLCFLIVGLCYAAIFILIWLSTKKSGLSISRSEIRMATKMFLIVLTDFCCWIPIGLVSILVQAGAVELNPVAYAWIATFILPINSSINPFLYTLGDIIAEKVSCSCKKCKKQSSDVIEMRTIFE